MRFTKKTPNIGDVRERTSLGLIFPKTINGEIRWINQ